MRIGYLDIFCGISGDMMLGALVDAGVDPVELEHRLRALPVQDWALEVGEAKKNGLRATCIKVVSPVHPHNHDHNHDPEHTHAHEDGHDHGHSHDHHHDHSRDHVHPHPDSSSESTQEPIHRHEHGKSADEVLGWITDSTLPAGIIERATAVVERIARAEALSHGVPRSEVHFHELAGIDTVIDVVGTVIGLDMLGIERLYCSPLPVTHGFVNTAHGRLPVPVPAVANLLQNVPTRPLDISGETVTPTGAALAISLANFSLFPQMTVTAVGWGAGQRDFPVPNLLRLFVGEAVGEAVKTVSGDTMVLIEANIDDMSGELLAHALQKIFAAGAADAWCTPIMMKKGRPATLVAALAPPPKAAAVVETFLRETSTLGVRRHIVERTCLPRETMQVDTEFGTVAVKIGLLNGEAVTVAPEFEDCAALAQSTGACLKNIHAAAVQAAYDSLRRSRQ